MNFLRFVVLLILFVIIYMLVVEVFTVLLRMTGISEEKARTQVISLLTNCGFTTSESELVLASRRRRRLAQITILIGYSFSVLIISLLVNLFLALNQAEVRGLVLPVLLLLALMTMLLVVMRLSPVRHRFDQMIERMTNRYLYGKNVNALILIDVYNKKSMIEVSLDHVPPFLAGLPLAQCRLKEDYQIQILSISRHGEPLECIDGHTCLVPGDLVIFFGDGKNIRSLFGRLEIA